MIFERVPLATRGSVAFLLSFSLLVIGGQARAWTRDEVRALCEDTTNAGANLQNPASGGRGWVAPPTPTPGQQIYALAPALTNLTSLDASDPSRERWLHTLARQSQAQLGQIRGLLALLDSQGGETWTQSPSTASYRKWIGAYEQPLAELSAALARGELPPELMQAVRETEPKALNAIQFLPALWEETSARELVESSARAGAEQGAPSTVTVVNCTDEPIQGTLRVPTLGNASTGGALQTRLEIVDHEVELGRYEAVDLEFDGVDTRRQVEHSFQGRRAEALQSTSATRDNRPIILVGGGR